MDPFRADKIIHECFAIWFPMETFYSPYSFSRSFLPWLASSAPSVIDVVLIEKVPYTLALCTMYCFLSQLLTNGSIVWLRCKATTPRGGCIQGWYRPEFQPINGSRTIGARNSLCGSDPNTNEACTQPSAHRGGSLSIDKPLALVGQHHKIWTAYPYLTELQHDLQTFD